MAYNGELKDASQEVVYPLTKTINVFDSNNISLSTLLDNININMNAKANINASNITVSSYQTKLNNMAQAGTGQTKQGQAVVVESYLSSDGKTWYRIWSDNWKECGGCDIISSSWGDINVTLPVTFSNTNYTVILGLDSVAGDKISYNDIGLHNKTTTQIRMISSPGVIRQYYACGY